MFDLFNVQNIACVKTVRNVSKTKRLENNSDVPWSHAVFTETTDYNICIDTTGPFGWSAVFHSLYIAF